jgi:hypothetical protein
MRSQKFFGAPGVFFEGLAVAKEGTHHILENGEPAYLERYDLVETFQDGLAWAKKGQVWVRINRQGQEIKKSDYPTDRSQIKVVCTPISYIKAGENLLSKMYKKKELNERKCKGKWYILFLILRQLCG